MYIQKLERGGEHEGIRSHHNPYIIDCIHVSDMIFLYMSDQPFTAPSLKFGSQLNVADASGRTGFRIFLVVDASG